MKRRTTQHHQRTRNHRNSPLPASHPKRCCRRAAKQTRKTLRAPQPRNDFTLLAPLVRKCEDFQSAEALNETLGNLHNLLAEGRISPRRAAVIAYVDSLILRTLPAMAKEDGATSIIFDMPGPDRDRPERDKVPTPAPTYADLRT